ncbi:hypothetical protein BU15DRAFT_53930 [Melanogaster broomeanus]|nr:hypothetical protein BU15DRAFT_53930 [Melanogaster broomeanus]
MALTQLPTELLCQILGYLDVHQLVHARKICKAIKNAIDCSELLQYTIDLGFYQMSEGKSPLGQNMSQVPVVTRRKELHQFETSWQGLQCRHRTTFPLPISGPVYEFVGGIYALTGENHIRFAVLPDHANPPGGPITTWDYAVDTASLIDFTFSPSLDLLVLVMMTATHHQHVYDLHLCSLSTNKPHPRAALPVLKALRKSDAAPDFYQGIGPVKLQLMGEYLAILCRDTIANGDDVADYLQMWTWTTENGYRFVLRFEETMNDFTFLSADRFLLLCDDGTLVIYSFTDKDSSPMCTASLAMPSLMRDWQFAHAFLGGNPVPETIGMSAVGFPFHPNSDDQLLAFHVTVFRSTNESDTHSFVYFIMRSTILRMEGVYQERSDSTTDTEPPEPPTLPWALWGPDTHWFPDSLNVDWQNSVYGFRTVESLNEDNVLGGYFSRRPRKLRVRDFNPNLAFHYHKEDLSGWNGRFVPGQRMGRKGTGIIRPFVEPLGKGLSYREVVSRESFDVTEAMMDESRILLLRRRAENGELEKVEVLVM